MIPSSFDYVRATSVEDALRLLDEHGDEAKLLAGGHSLIPMLKLRLAAPSVLVDIGSLPLASIDASPDGLRIGALTRHATIAQSDQVRRTAPALWDAANVLGDPQVRNRGTIGGACAHGDPSADFPAVMLALDARFTMVEAGGERTVPADQFFVGMFETELGERAILTSVAIPAAPRSAYVKLHHPASHYALVGAAVKLELDGEQIRSARVALTGAGDVAFRATGVERALAGVRVADPAALKAACADAAEGHETRSDLAASAEYRRAMADVYVARAVAAAFARR